MNSPTASPGCPHLTGYDPLAARELADPYPTWALAREHAPVFRSAASGLWFITRYDDVAEAIRDTTTFSSAFGGSTLIDALAEERREDLEAATARGYPDDTRFLITTDSPAHNPRRKLAQQAFTPSSVARLEPAISRFAHELCDTCQMAGEFEVMGDFAYGLTARVIAAILGLGDELAGRLRQVAEDLLVINAPPHGTLSATQADDVLARATRISAMHGDVHDVLRQRRRSPRDDVLSGLAAARLQNDVALDDEDILALVAEMILAGTDTTANLIAQAVLFASPDRELWQEIGRDRSTAAAVVEEALRRRGSSKGLFRVTTRDVAVAGVQIPAGALVHLLYGSANHDETRFPDPRAFVLRRSGIDRHLAFGRGTHFCLGAPLARVESRIALEHLSTRFPDLEVAPDAELHYLPTITTHTLAALPVRATGFGAAAPTSAR